MNHQLTRKNIPKLIRYKYKIQNVQTNCKDLLHWHLDMWYTKILAAWKLTLPYVK